MNTLTNSFNGLERLGWPTSANGICCCTIGRISLGDMRANRTIKVFSCLLEEKSILPLMDPAFASAVCRYDLTDGPLKLTTPVSPAYTSVTFYSNKDVSYYAINDRAAGRRTIELDLMTAAQRAQIQDDEEVAAADRLIVESPSRTGLIVLRALAAEPGMMPAAVSALAGARCVRIQQ